MSMKTQIKAVVAAACLATLASPAFADGQVRGGMTAVHNVAGNLAKGSEYKGFRWESGIAKSSVNNPESASSTLSKWDEVSDRPADTRNLAVAETTADANATRTRWVIKNDADQARTRWVIKNDADQARTRWVIKNDADQARTRWVIKNDADQARTRWVIK